MAFFQYLVFDGENLPLPDSYEVELEDVEADSGGETEAGTTQRDVVRHGVAHQRRPPGERLGEDRRGRLLPEPSGYPHRR